MAFPRLQELAAAQNSNNLTDAMSVYIQKKINDDLQFATGLSQLREVLYSRVDGYRLLIAELNVFGHPLAISQTSVKKSAMDSSFTFGSTEEADNVKILQSCNGLLLCSGSGRPVFDYIYNPSTNQYKKLSHPYCSLDNSPYYRSIENWSLCMDHFNYFSFDHFDSAIYWNDALHWRETKNRQLMHYKLNIKDHEHPIVTTIQIPQRGINFLESYGYMDPMLILIQIPHLLHLEGKLFESHGCLLLVCRDDIGSSVFTIYKMMIGYSVWTVRYRVDTDDFMTPLPEGWLIRSTIWRITLHEIYDCGSNQLDDNHDDDDDDDELLQQSEAEHNVYEFIPSFASV
ncbi:hypothetical protein Tco_0683611 [Tanacetum coccineum]